jgi:virginiamycin B lyase
MFEAFMRSSLEDWTVDCRPCSCDGCSAFASRILVMSMRVVSAAVIALSFTYGPALAQQTWPPGPGKDLVQGVCAQCHQMREIERSLGYTREGWDELTATMIDLSPMPDERKVILDYLAAHYPPAEKRPAKIIPGPYRIETKTWTTLKLGQRARDPVEAPDGSIWYVGQWGNVIGRIDPKTDKVQEWDLPSRTLPHSVMVDKAGGVWFLGNGNGTIGKFDPATGKSTVYKMPLPNAKDPHTGEFDSAGIFWFTLQASNMIGRFDPATSETKLVSTPPGAKPYGIKFDKDGAPWVACNGAPCLLKVDRQTMALTEIKLPLPDTTVRRLDIAPDGRIWYVNSGKGRLGVHDPKTGATKEWASPSGQSSHPYGINVLDGAIWYNESGVRPDTLVRFDPESESFQSWPLASGSVYAGIHRNGHVTRDGKSLLLHQSATNRIIRVTPHKPAVR